MRDLTEFSTGALLDRLGTSTGYGTGALGALVATIINTMWPLHFNVGFLLAVVLATLFVLWHAANAVDAEQELMKRITR